MTVNAKAVEVMQFVPAFAPVDMSTGAGPTSDWVTMKDFRRCAIVFSAGVGTTGNDSTITLLQATSVTGTSSKALNFSEVYVKQGLLVNAIAQFTKTDNPTADNSYTSDTSGESELVWVIEIKAEDLDIDGGFDCIQASVNDHGAAKVGSVLYVLYDAVYGVDPALGAIAN
ncbi:MAG: hypothetical protein WC322_01530 [Candidatus Paceibacterota bacterium]|jgi:hypothetical protein